MFHVINTGVTKKMLGRKKMQKSMYRVVPLGWEEQERELLINNLYF